MSRVFLSNFDFEHRLAGVHRKNAAAISEALSYAWLSIAGSSDCVHGLPPLSSELIHALESIGRTRPSTELTAGSTLVPWGWDAYARSFGESNNLDCLAPSTDAVELVNSRAFSVELENRLGCGLPGAVGVVSPDDFREVTAGLPSWVAKAEFSMSSRERLIGRREPNESQAAWCEKRLGEAQTVFVEPWVHIVEECGTQFEITPAGDVVRVGTTGLLTTEKGAFAGCWLQSDIEREWLDESAVEAVATEAAAAGYFGPIGVDSALCVVDGEQVARPIQDVNGRYTMGRLALGWGDVVAAGEVAAWLFLPGTDGNSVAEIRRVLDQYEVVRTIHISRNSDESRPGLNTWLLISDNPMLLRDACRSVFSSTHRELRI